VPYEDLNEPQRSDVGWRWLTERINDVDEVSQRRIEEYTGSRQAARFTSWGGRCSLKEGKLESLAHGFSMRSIAQAEVLHERL
jgi:hypothetical protein